MTSPLPKDTHIGYVRLIVADLERSLLFYRDLLGLSETKQVDGISELASNPGEMLIYLEEQPEARPKPPRTTGLYHVAIRLPTRQALGEVLTRLIGARYPLQGASDHLVSEAIYLADPDGNGIELYTDRPREQWPKQDGQVAMASKPLDLQGLLAEAETSSSVWEGIARETDIGHIHLQVSNLNRAEAFYGNLLGFEVTQRSYPGALFLSAGGYHHHIGLNIWAGEGAPPPPPGSLGLSLFSVDIRTQEARQELISRLENAGANMETVQDPAGKMRFIVADPDGNRVVL